MDTLKKAWEAGFRDATWGRRDPDLAILHGEPEFDTLYPAPANGEHLGRISASELCKEPRPEKPLADGVQYRGEVRTVVFSPRNQPGNAIRDF